MQIQEIAPKLNDEVTLRQPYSSYFLPEVLTEGSKATVVGISTGILEIASRQPPRRPSRTPDRIRPYPKTRQNPKHLNVYEPIGSTRVSRVSF